MRKAIVIIAAMFLFGSTIYIPYGNGDTGGMAIGPDGTTFINKSGNSFIYSGPGPGDSGIGIGFGNGGGMIIDNNPNNFGGNRFNHRNNSIDPFLYDQFD